MAHEDCNAASDPLARAAQGSARAGAPRDPVSLDDTLRRAARALGARAGAELRRLDALTGGVD
ncbi:hypothetical protein [Ideonella sp. A 288]|uniref:hypothetical protein n=1 Tax=Ideonella sp. A 288 TaxID=1962181 RepID=UPI00118490D0|nr:hypothetical protein [Ideonella sp. A 288]